MGAIKEPQTSDQTADYETIRAIVAAWPEPLRAALVHELINTFVSKADNLPPKRRRDSLSQALGLLNMGQPAPSDEEVKRIIQEHREAKYG
jgi:hypothetical protein